MVNESPKRTLELENVGPIKRLSIPVPESGLVVLRAKNGKGKTKALEACKSLVTQTGGVTVRDGALKGSVTGFGASINVARSTRRSGELEVTSIEGRLSPADLVDPGMKSPEAADAKRILALVQLSGVAPDASLFHDLIGGQAAFEAVCKTKARDENDDIITMAGRIKRDFETAARLVESHRDTALGHAKASREAAGNVDVAAECESPVLQSRMEQAVRNQTTIAERKKAADQAARNADEARANLAKCKDDPNAVTLEQVIEQETAAAAELLALTEAVADAEAALREAKRKQELGAANLRAVQQSKRAAESRATLIDGWEAAIAAAADVTPPTPEEIAEADAAVLAARQAVELGALVRRAKEHIASAVRSETEAAEFDAQAEHLRNAAKGTDEVLSGLVAKLGTPLRVEAGRLVLDTERGETYFGELSMGQRWKLVIDICVDVVGAAGVLTIPQEAFEGLDPFNRDEIAEHAKKRGVLILTAEASADEEIVAEEYEVAGVN